MSLPGRRFDAVYFTPLVYSFIPGRRSRVTALERLEAHLEPRARVILSVDRIHSPSAYLRAILSWSYGRLRGLRSIEFGDWFSTYLSPNGTLERSFLRSFSHRQIRRELEDGGFRFLGWDGSAGYVAEKPPHA